MTDQDALKYYAARYVWNRQQQRTPTGITWRVWWERKWSDDYARYTKEQREKQG